MTANAQGGWKRGTAVLVAVGVVAACGDTSGESRAEVEPSPPVAPRPAGPEPLVLPTGGPPVALAPEAAASWQLRELVHLPRYFQLVGWKDSATLWGRAGCNPVEVRVDAPEYRAWDVPACGGAASAPGGQRLAWGDGKGRLWVGE